VRDVGLSISMISMRIDLIEVILGGGFLRIFISVVYSVETGMSIR